MKKIFIVLFICIANILLAREPVVPGRVRVKLKPASNERMIRFSPAMKYAGASVTAGKPKFSVSLETLDALNEKHEAVSMRRVFPHAGKHERKQEKFGLHLWYDIETGDGTNPTELAKVYLADGNVDIAEPVLRVKYHTGFHEPGIKASDRTGSNPDTIKPQAFVPADPDYPKQWHYNNTGQTGGTSGIDIGLKDAWTLTKGRSEVIVAVVDGGVDYSHEDLKHNMWTNVAELNGSPGVDDDGNGYVDDVHGFNFVDGYGFNPMINPVGPAPIVPSKHGTHVAGTVAAGTDNGKGGAGVAGGDRFGGGVRLMSCQTLMDDVDKGAYLGAAMVYAANNGAVIMQNSWGFEREDYESASIREAIKYFIECAGADENGNPLPGTPMLGGIVIFAAGNESSSGKWYPARYDEVSAVASLNHYGKRAHYSNFGDWVDLAAPGGDTDEKTSGGVYSTLPGNKYGYSQGTSMACPHVSGVAALVLSRFGSGSYTPDKLRDRLMTGVDSLPADAYAPFLGVGLINARKAVADYVNVTGVSLRASVTVPLGRTTQLTADIRPTTATDKRVAWSTGNPSVASINEKGVMEGKVLGTTTVKVRTNDGHFEATATVNVVPVRVESVTISIEDINIIKGNSEQLTAAIFPLDATNLALSWRSTKPDIASVNNEGTVTARELGSALVIVETADGGFADTCRIAVVEPVVGVHIERETVRLLKGDTLTIVAEVSPHDAFDKTVIWRSSNTDILSVNAGSGRVLAKKPGKATITARTNDGNYEAYCEASVYEAVHASEGFSPDGDGVNDCFMIIIDSRKTYTLRVFDRSGQIYYESADYGNDWDGTANTGFRKGSKVPPGTYFYSLSSKDGSEKRGYVVIRY